MHVALCEHILQVTTARTPGSHRQRFCQRSQRGSFPSPSWKISAELLLGRPGSAQLQHGLSVAVVCGHHRVSLLVSPAHDEGAHKTTLPLPRDRDESIALKPLSLVSKELSKRSSALVLLSRSKPFWAHAAFS